jgi:arsenate reductase (thioredoxin)
MTSTNMTTKDLEYFIKERIQEFDLIPEQRKIELEKIAAYVRSKTQSNLPAKLIFICTHNSRRSHLSQIWAQTAAHFYGVSIVDTFSGGTEATAFNPNAVKAMKEAGFKISVVKEGKNPIYEVRFSDDAPAMEVYSKVFDQGDNPTTDFAAIMTCSHADENCPFIPGASLRIPVTYEDPKNFDGTPQQDQAYLERSQQIAREMFYLFSKV